MFNVWDGLAIFFSPYFGSKTSAQEYAINLLEDHHTAPILSKILHLFVRMFMCCSTHSCIGHHGHIQDGLQKIFRIIENFPNYPETSQSIRTLSRLSGNPPDLPETVKIIWKLPRFSGDFPGYPETFRTIRKIFQIFTLSENFPDYLETFQIIRKLPRTFTHFSENSSDLVAGPFPYLTLKYSIRPVDCCPANYLCEFGRNVHLIIKPWYILSFRFCFVLMSFSFSSYCPP